MQPGAPPRPPAEPAGSPPPLPPPSPPCSPGAAYAPAVLRLRLEREGGAQPRFATADPPAPPARFDGACAARPAIRSGCPVALDGSPAGEGGADAATVEGPPAGRPPRRTTLDLRELTPVPIPYNDEAFVGAAADGWPGTTESLRRRHRGIYHLPLAVGLGLSARRAAASAVTATQPFFLPASASARRRPAIPLREPPSPTSVFVPASSRQGACKPAAGVPLPSAMGAPPDDLVRGGTTRPPSSVSRTGVGTAAVRPPPRDRPRDSVAGAEARGLIVSPWVFPSRVTAPSRGPRLIRRIVTAASGKGGYEVVVPSTAVAGASGMAAQAEARAAGRDDGDSLVGGADHASKTSLVSIASSSAPWWSTSPAAPPQQLSAMRGPQSTGSGECKQPVRSADGPRPLLPLDLDEPLRSTDANAGSVLDEDSCVWETELDDLDSSVSSASASGDVAYPMLPPSTPAPPLATRVALPADVPRARDDCDSSEFLPPGVDAVRVSPDTDDGSGLLALDPAPKLPTLRRRWRAADSWLSSVASGSDAWSLSASRPADALTAGAAATSFPSASPHPPPSSSSPRWVHAPPSPRRPPLPPPSLPSFNGERSHPSSRRPPLPPRSTSGRSPRDASMTGRRPSSPLLEEEVMLQPGPSQGPPNTSTVKPRRHIFWGGVNSTASTVQTWSSSMSSGSAKSVSSSGSEEELDLEESGSSRRGWFLRTVGGGTTRSGLQSKRPPGLPPLW